MRLLILSVLMLALVASSAFAARRSSLGGNLLIKDVDDIFFFPQRVADYQRHVTFDLGTSSGLGSGGMIFGNETTTIGVFAHRSDFIGGIPNAFFTAGDIASIGEAGTNHFNGLLSPVAPGAPNGSAFNWIDVLVGFSNNPDTPFGVRFSVGRSSVDQGQETDPTKSSAHSFNVAAGATVNDVDISGEFSYAKATAESGPAATRAKDEISPIHFSAAVRKTAEDSSDDLQLGWLGEFTFISGSLDETVQGSSPSKTDVSAFAFVAGAGPVYMPHDRTTVAFYGTVEFLRENAELSGGGATTTTKFTEQSTVIPGWYLASEVELASWLQARAGFRSRFMLNSGEQPGAGTAVDKPSSTSLEFNWYSGVGIDWDNFSIDGYLNPAVITSGTDLLGNSSQLFGMVTASMDF